jgi:hypothetical protein
LKATFAEVGLNTGIFPLKTNVCTERHSFSYLFNGKC